ncbi:hypothetical protein HD806DRAFT_527941 [Xylariaceae sp. AK1471]|nr:hypothetical protein HD806DRAFT_527941 [Xylariaceae sp. AK1471]
MPRMSAYLPPVPVPNRHKCVATDFKTYAQEHLTPSATKEGTSKGTSKTNSKSRSRPKQKKRRKNQTAPVADLKKAKRVPLIDLTSSNTSANKVHVPARKVELVDMNTSPRLTPEPTIAKSTTVNNGFLGKIIGRLPLFDFSAPSNAPEFPLSPRRVLEQKDPNDMGPAPPTLSRLNLSEANWRRLEHSSRLTLPRFLFRGFRKDSGGGFDARLNSKDGIVPHGFLNGRKPTHIYDIPNLSTMISKHLGSSTNIQSQFSSWAVDFWVARDYTDKNGCVAILDTTMIESHVRAYHVPALIVAGLADTDYKEEYLVYGPIRGPAFHCVPYNQLEKGGLKMLRSSHTLVSWETRVLTAKTIANLLRPSRDQRPDIIIAVTTMLACLSFHLQSAKNIAGDLYTALKIHLSEEMKMVQLPPLDCKAQNLGLVNPYTYAKQSVYVGSFVDMLQRLENQIRRDRKKLKRPREH